MEKHIDLQTFDDDNLRNRGKTSISDVKGQEFDRDRYELARVGKEQVLKRRFGFVSMTGLGGPAGLIYGFLLIWLGNFSVFICIGELASAVPTAGGQYHWVSLLAPRSNKRFFSYITDLVLQLATLNSDGTYVRENWHATLLLWAILMLCVFINVFVSGALPTIEVVVLIVHVLGFFGILVPLVYLTPAHNSAREIFTTFHNKGKWETQALAFFVGLQGNALAFVGTDSVVHMSEEVKNASTDVPRSMLTSLAINGTLAVGMLLAVLFSASDIEALLMEDSALSPFIRIFRGAVGSSAGATIMIDKRTTIPVIAILVVTVFSALLALINIGNNAAFNGTISLVLEGFYLSYLLAIGLLLWRRVRGDLDSQSSDLTIFNSSPHHDEAYDRSLTWGPWRLKGALGIANNAVAICYLVLIIFFSFWPTQMNPTIAQMNWAVVVTGAVATFSVVYYVLYARKSYTGPIVEVDPHVM
ncbi:hypothetical protein N0V94_007150 [Neodidymelliopsis sp. IMI 364377]|nr:hypothetical protein N0V94_007150 [Neodidymelliopsis sp. IMI 364377]